MDQAPDVAADEIQLVAYVVQRMGTRFPNIRPEAIERVVTEAFHEFDGLPVRAFVPILVERSVINRFRGADSSVRQD